MASQRQLKFANLIQEELAAIFIKDLQGSFTGALVTISEVNVSPDLKIARVHYTVMPDQKVMAIEGVLEAKTNHIRNLLGRRIRHQVRAIPELHFYYDDSVQEAMRINQLIDSLDIPEKGEEEE